MQGLINEDEIRLDATVESVAREITRTIVCINHALKLALITLELSSLQNEESIR